MSLERRIILFFSIILSLTITANTGMDIAGFRRDYVQALVLRSQSLAESMKGSIEKVLALGLDLEDLQDIPERCRDLVKGNPEIAYCIVTDLKETVLFSSEPRYRKAAEIVLGRNGSSHLVVGGKEQRCHDSVFIISSPEGKPVGNVHVGFSDKVVEDKVEMMILRSFIVLVFFLLLALGMILVFVKKGIMQPISTLLEGVKRITAGSLDRGIEPISIPEFNTLASTLNYMSDSIRSREDELRRSYHDLEAAHANLRRSYVELESLRNELEKSEELYKSIMEDSSDAIVVVDGEEKVLMVNKMAERLFGYSFEELTGLPFSRFLLLVGVTDIPHTLRLVNNASQGGHVAGDVQIVNKSGAQIVARIAANRIKTSGDGLVQATIRDVTREDQIIRNLEQSAENLARLNRMKDSFLGLASHELKTPLTVIMGYADLLCSEKERLDSGAAEMVENILSASHRLDSIIRDMVDVSMIDEKKLQLRSEEVNLNRLLELSANELRFFLSLRKQELVMNLDESIPLVKGDPGRLMQLFLNIFGNAVKFTPDGGTITAGSRVKYLLRSRQTGDHSTVNIGREQHLYVEITISDTGIGIDQDEQLYIFEKFYEGGKIEEHSSGKTGFNAKGAGLGLAIAKGIVEVHGGEIWVESPGHDSSRCPGSTFHILLPLDPLLGDRTLDYMNLLS